MSGAHGVARQFASKLQLRAQTAHILDFYPLTLCSLSAALTTRPTAGEVEWHEREPVIHAVLSGDNHPA